MDETNIGYGNTGNYNLGNRNTGGGNAGNDNVGDHNTGNYNFGSYNAGNYNAGNWNSGNNNIGNGSTGRNNIGNGNTGNDNAGNYNLGNNNAGSYNSGNWNSGSFNTGSCNTGSRDGICGDPNAVEPTQISVFNRPCDLAVWDAAYKPAFMYFSLTYWVRADDMTDDEKASDPNNAVRGEQLRSLDYKTAFKKSWDNASPSNRELVKLLPNFDAEVFYEISGIDLR